MKKAIVVVVAAGLLYLFGQYLYRALASEETRIGWLLDDVERGFNTCRAGLTVEGFSEKFREKTARISVFHYRRKKEFEVAWTVEIDADLENGPDGWKIVSSTHQGVDGKRPF